MYTLKQGRKLKYLQAQAGNAKWEQWENTEWLAGGGGTCTPHLREAEASQLHETRGLSVARSHFSRVGNL